MVDLSHGREGFYFLGCHLRKTLQRSSLGAGAATRLLSPAVAVTASYGVGADSYPTAHPSAPLSHRPSRRHCRREQGGSRLGGVLPDGQCGTPVSPAGCVRRGSVTAPASSACRCAAGSRPGRPLAASLLRGPWPGPHARDDSVSGGRLMRRLERPLGSRVREIRTHGLNGGPTCNPAVLRQGLG